MSLIYSDKPCDTYSYHCAISRTDNTCTFCGIDTTDFIKPDWNKRCPEAMKLNIKLSHNYRIEHIRGYVSKDQDYNQIVHYRCVNCNDKQVRRDD